jgi:hypothetical protein
MINLEFVFRNADNLETKASTPALLNPILLMIASSFFKRNNLGLSLPSCAMGVTVPTSTNPKPNLSRRCNHFPSLSKPAANPKVFRNCRPNNCLCNNSCSNSNVLKNSFEKIGIFEMRFNKSIDK